MILIGGLLLLGAPFAINPSLHSYLIVSYAQEDDVSLDVGFYYMSNAIGRLVRTVLPGWIYQSCGLEACLWISSGFGSSHISRPAATSSISSQTTNRRLIQDHCA